MLLDLARKTFAPHLAPGSDPLQRTLINSGLLSMAVRAAGVVVAYSANVLLSRLLGISAFGEYVVALSWALVLALPAKAGFDNSTLRFSSLYLERGELTALRGFIRVAAGVTAACSIIIGVLAYAFGARFIPVGGATLALAAALVLPLSLLGTFSVIMRTARRILAAQAYEQVLRPGLIIMGATALWLAGTALTPSIAMLVTVAAASIAAIGIFAHLRRALPEVRSRRPSYDSWPSWISVSFTMLLMGSVQELMNQIDILFLGQLADTREAALFAASWRIASLVPFALVGLSILAAPAVASAYDRHATDELCQTSRVIARLGFGFGLASTLFLLLTGSWLLRMFGPEFAAGYPALAVLALGGVVNAFAGIVTYFMTMTGREREALGIFAVSLLIAIILNLLLIPRWGALGAAIASSSGTAAWNLLMLIYVRRKLGFDASALALRPALRE